MIIFSNEANVPKAVNPAPSDLSLKEINPSVISFFSPFSFTVTRATLPNGNLQVTILVKEQGKKGGRELKREYELKDHKNVLTDVLKKCVPNFNCDASDRSQYFNDLLFAMEMYAIERVEMSEQIFKLVYADGREIFYFDTKPWNSPFKGSTAVIFFDSYENIFTDDLKNIPALMFLKSSLADIGEWNIDADCNLTPHVTQNSKEQIYRYWTLLWRFTNFLAVNLPEASSQFRRTLFPTRILTIFIKTFNLVFKIINPPFKQFFTNSDKKFVKEIIEFSERVYSICNGFDEIGNVEEVIKGLEGVKVGMEISCNIMPPRIFDEMEQAQVQPVIDSIVLRMNELRLGEKLRDQKKLIDTLPKDEEGRRRIGFMAFKFRIAIREDCYLSENNFKYNLKSSKLSSSEGILKIPNNIIPIQKDLAISLEK